MSDANPESTVETKTILDVLSDDMGPIPPYLMNLMGFLGYNTYETLKDFSLADINDIERFARDELLRLLSDSVEEKRKYFGPYFNIPKMFRILPGHKKLILTIPSYMKGAHEDNANREHFIRRLTWSHPKRLQRSAHKRSLDSLSSAVEELEESDQSLGRVLDDDDYEVEEEEDERMSDGHNDSSSMAKMNYIGESASDPKRIRFEGDPIKTHNDDHRIRDTINRWLLNVKEKLRPGTTLLLPLRYAIRFHSRAEEGKMSAAIECCMCHIQIGISSHRNKNGSRRWLISNFMRHVKKTHFQAQHQQLTPPTQQQQQHQPQQQLLQQQQQQQQQQLINIVDISTLVKREVE